MEQYELKYGCNPGQAPARVYVQKGALPFAVLNGRPGYINFLDAFGAWQLVRELRGALKLPAAASFKHVSPAGAAVGLALPEELRRAYMVAPGAELSPLACAYARARGADRVSSYGDWAALSDVCDEETALLLQGEVSDGVIAPGYTQAALEVLRRKKKGVYNIVQMDPDYAPAGAEQRDVFGVTFEQGRNNTKIESKLLKNVVTCNSALTAAQTRDLLVALITTKYTQSNSVCYAKDGQAIGVGAGQQSRIQCTRLAGDKADLWHLRQSPQALSLVFREGAGRPARDNAVDNYLRGDMNDMIEAGEWKELFEKCPEPFTDAARRAVLAGVGDVALASDAFFPFEDNILRAHKSGVACIAQPGGSVRDADVIAACDKFGIAMAFTGLRLFCH